MPNRQIAAQLERNSVLVVECTIPNEMTLAEWRRARARSPRKPRPWLRRRQR